MNCSSMNPEPVWGQVPRHHLTDEGREAAQQQLQQQQRELE